jgi:hypothetical protein
MTVVRIALGAALASAALLACSAAAAQAPDLSKWRPQVTPMSAEQIDQVAAHSPVPTDCFWSGSVSPSSFNILFPDSGVTYWAAQYKLPAGAKLYLQGQFVHGRHMSFTTYDAQGLPVDRLNDLMIAPEPGSVNPFQVGARRDGEQRDYRIDLAEAGMGQVNVADGRGHGNRLFANAVNGVQQLWYRVYVPDHGQDVRGGVALPQPLLVLADGRSVAGAALCKQIVVKDGAIRDVRLPAEVVHQMYALGGAQAPLHPAHDPLLWNAFFNPPLSVTNALLGTPYAALRDKLDTTRRNGFYGTLDNTYMSAYIDQRFGPVLVLHAKAPTTPHTFGNDQTMQAAQLRYWSVCKNRSLADTAVDSCVYDEQVPLDRDGSYTIVVSTAAQRPANARAECGVAWLDWGGAGDGIGNPDGGFLIYRHMMPSAEFYRHSLFGTTRPGDEAAVLGEYFPQSTYMDRAAFERRGCAAIK